MKLIHIHCHSDSGEKISTYQLEFHPDLLAVYEEMGIIEVIDDCIRYEELQRLQKILRLKRNCGVNTVGATIIVDLLEKIEKLQDELDSLQNR
jgi:MerR family transcriptional regulator, heat shock protein HspR